MLATSHLSAGQGRTLIKKSDMIGRAAHIAGYILSVLAVVLVCCVNFAEAQDITPDMLRALQQRGSGEGNNQTAAPDRPVVQTYQPVGEQAPAPPSVLEALYSRRAGRTLTQVGYETLGSAAAVSVVQNGALQDGYILGVGDELLFELRGQENSSYRERVDKSGSIVLPKLNPIPAAGRTLAEFRQSLAAEVSRAYVSTTAFVSLGEVHQVSVLVTGFVRTPGMRIVSALASPIDALLLSGGITKAGSLRNVQLIRDGSTHTIDLYSLLLRGASGRIGMLQDGDRIYVAPLGATVAVAGSVRRPGIYELPTGTSAINARALVSLAGGVVIANAYDISKTMLDRDGTTRLIPIPGGSNVRSGEVVFVDPSRTADLDRVTVSGAVQQPGERPLSSARTTGELFHSVNDLLPNAYTPLALIVHRQAATNATMLVPFSLIHALSHNDTAALESNDAIYVFSEVDLRAIARFVAKGINTPYAPPRITAPAGTSATTPVPTNSAAPSGTSAGGLPANSAAQPSGAATSRGSTGPVLGGSSLSAASDPRLRAGVQSNSPASIALAEGLELERSELGNANGPTAIPTETDEQIVSRVATALGVPQEMLLRTIGDHLVWVLDQVHVPGVYAAAVGTTLPEMIEAAGGAETQADLSSIEVTSTDFDRLAGVSRTIRSSYVVTDDNFRTASIKPLDVIRLRQVYADRTGESVTVAGQVRYPGVFDITRDERLSSVLQRAGGLTEVAYPYGAVFTRRSAALHEQEGNERSASELQSQLAVLMASPTQAGAGPQEGAVSFLAGLVQEVRNAPTLGRVTVTADPVVLAARPDLDVILEPGDAVYIPKRPSNVAVSGEVLNPGSFQFRSNLGFDDYVRLAGGPTQAADSSNAFVVLPDGTAMPSRENWLAFGSSGHIPPGSTIVMPRDLRPFDWGQFLKDATQVLSQLAIAGASLAVLQNNN